MSKRIVVEREVEVREEENYAALRAAVSGAQSISKALFALGVLLFIGSVLGMLFFSADQSKRLLDYWPIAAAFGCGISLAIVGFAVGSNADRQQLEIDQADSLAALLEIVEGMQETQGKLARDMARAADSLERLLATIRPR